MAKTQAEAISLYYDYLRQGMSPNEAYSKAVEGMPTQEEMLQEEGAAQQEAGLASVGGTLAGVIGTKYLYDNLVGKVGEEAAKEIVKNELANRAVSNVATSAAENVAWNAGADVASQQAAQLGAEGASQAAGEAAAQTGGVTASQALGGAGALYGGYKAFQGLQNGGEGLRSGLTTMGSGIGTMILPGVGTALGAAGGNILGYGLQGDGLKNDLALAAMTGGVALIPGVGDALRGLIRKTTKQHQQEKWGDLTKAEDLPTQQYASQYLNYLNSDQAKVDAEHNNTFDAKREAGTLSAEDVWGGHGLFETFGSDWLGKYSEDQRRQISQAAIDNNLLGNSKGDITVTDPQALMSLAQGITSGQQSQSRPGSTLSAALTGWKQLPGDLSATAHIKPATNIDSSILDTFGIQKLPKGISPIAQAFARSKTLSPGIDLNGNRIKY